MKIRVRYYHWIPKLLGVGAITLYPYILIASEKFETTERLLRHELEHVYQVRKSGWVKFYFLYLKEYFGGLLRHRSHHMACLNISFEIDARRAEGLALEEEQRIELGLV